MYDVVIIGAGAAGLSAALYASRRRLNTIVLTKDVGGQTATTLDIQNYPGIAKIEGPALMHDFQAQAEHFGAQVVSDPVVAIVPDGQNFTIATESGKQLSTRSVILAFGKTPRHLDVPGEAEFMNKGVVYCATCDAPLFAGKTVAVVGGGSAAADAALLLSKIAAKIYLIHRRSELRAEEVLIEQMRQEPKIEMILNTKVREILGDKFVNRIAIASQSGESRDLNVQGVFVEVGYKIEAEFLGDLVQLTQAQEIVIDSFNQTSRAGVFAAGDVTTVPFKQTVISAGEGAKAALSAYNYLQGAAAGSAVEDHNVGI